MKEVIDTIDKRILFELDKNSRIPEVKLAKIIGKSKESVRYRIKKLKEQNILQGYTIWIDPIKLGYQTSKIYLNIANIPKRKKAFIEYVKKDKRLFWLGVAEGVWNIGLTYFVKDTNEFFELKNDLFSKFKDLILDNKTATVVSIHYHDKKFLHDAQVKWQTMFDKRENIELDNLSKNILKSLFENSRENIASLAYENNTSVEIVRNRLKNLVEKGIIKKYLSRINYSKLGYESYKTFLYFKTLNSQELKDIFDYLENSEYVTYIVKQVSPWDLELESYCKSFSNYNNMINALTEKFSKNIQKVETAIMTEDHLFPAKKKIFE